jgi:hypothetical protein
MFPGPADYDSPWKEAIDHDFRSFLEFFSPVRAANTDWSRDTESLDAELRKMSPAGEVGKRLADKLVKLYTPEGDERYLHVEVQGQRVQNMPERGYVYNYRGRDRFNHPVGTLIILADDDPDWRPDLHEEITEESSVTFRFRPVKLLDWRGREAELDANPQPFALLVRAHLGALATRQDAEARKELKWGLIQQLYWRFPQREDAVRWYRYLDWFLPLPAQDEEGIWQRLVQSEKEKNVTFISYGERRGLEEGLKQGRETEREELGGEVLRSVLRAKFQEAGEALLVGRQWKLTRETLTALVASLTTAASLDDARRILEQIP